MGNASEDEDYGGAASAATQAGDVEEMGRKLVRLALACEYQRKPIRRADIGEKVLGTHVRQFKHVFQSAQTHLRSVFGMEMCELPAKERITVQQKRGKSANNHSIKEMALTRSSCPKIGLASEAYDIVDACVNTTIGVPKPGCHSAAFSAHGSR